jgi:hypothetical protein
LSLAIAGCAGLDNRVPPWGADLVAVTQYNDVVSFNHGAPGTIETSARIHGVAEGDSVVAIDFRPGDGHLYALGNSGKIYLLNWRTGVATLKSSLHAASGDTYSGLDGHVFSINFDPLAGSLRTVSDSGQNLSIDVDSGEVRTQTAYAADKSVPLAAAFTTQSNGAFRSTLYVIDGRSNGLQSVLAPADAKTISVGSFGGSFGRYAGFDILGNESSGTAFAALSIPDTTTSKLYAVQLGAGTAKSYGTIGGDAKIRSLSIRPSIES